MSASREAPIRLLFSLLAAAALFAQTPGGRSVYKDIPRSPQSYEGPGREQPEPSGFADVPIGFFGPADAAHPVGGSFWLGASRAIAEENKAGGYRGKPFRLVPGWAENPWAGGAARVVRMAYVERVWAVLAGIDGSTAHLAEQVAAKALLPIVDMGSTDKTVNFANVPWLFSCLPSDEAIAAALGRLIGDKPFAILTSTEHDSRLLTKELREWLGRQQKTPSRVLEFSTAIPELPAGVTPVVVIAPSLESARAVQQIRAAAPEATIIGGPAMTRTAFLAAAGKAAEGARVPLLAAATKGSDYAAAQAYDATRLLIAAIRRAGLNRTRIRDALQALSPYSGTAGRIEWNVFGRNLRPVRTATIRDGGPVPD